MLLVKNHALSLSKVERVVFDEADTLFDTNQLESTSKALKQFKKNVKTLLFTATLPKTLVKATTELIPNIVQITTPNLHKIPSRIHHDFLNLNQSMTKPNLLLETLRRIVTVSDTTRVLVFCNKTTTASEVYSDLLDRKYPVILISSQVERQELMKNLHDFKSDRPEMLIAVATDMASRGIDTINVGQIINYDFPYNVIDYVHRVGRTGRFERGGRATSFLMKRDLKLAESIKNSIADRTALT
jgi:superfamily II DNA/RNA helicase